MRGWPRPRSVRCRPGGPSTSVGGVQLPARPDAFLLDLDGTLSASGPVIVRGIQHALAIDAVDHVGVVQPDQPIEVGVDEIQPRCRSPVAQQSWLDVLGRQIRAEQGMSSR